MSSMETCRVSLVLPFYHVAASEIQTSGSGTERLFAYCAYCNYRVVSAA